VPRQSTNHSGICVHVPEEKLDVRRNAFRATVREPGTEKIAVACRVHACVIYFTCVIATEVEHKSGPPVEIIGDRSAASVHLLRPRNYELRPKIEKRIAEERFPVRVVRSGSDMDIAQRLGFSRGTLWERELGP
jgi:hypothetical protein